jgi:hypothetical protein
LNGEFILSIGKFIGDFKLFGGKLIHGLVEALVL